MRGAAAWPSSPDCRLQLRVARAAGGDRAREALAAQATDPTAALMSFQLNDWYTPSFHGIGSSANQVVFRTALPFELAGTRHIFRLTAP